MKFLGEIDEKHTNCPTCGGLASYESGNWEKAEILISDESAIFKRDLRLAAISIAELEKELEVVSNIKTNLIELNSIELFALYKLKVRQEVLQADAKEVLRIEEMQKLPPIEWWDTITKLKE